MKRCLLALSTLTFLWVSCPVVAEPAPKLTLQELNTAPDSTVLKFGKQSYTLGVLRASHLAREAGLARARSAGLASAQALALRKKKSTPDKGRLTNEGLRAAEAYSSTPLVVEPPSKYASAPGDMKAFCSAASASACLYLPPNANLQLFPDGSSALIDPFIGQSQCSAEGGGWNYYDNACDFTYLTTVGVSFIPPGDYKVSYTQNCDPSVWAVSIDNKGSVEIRLLAASSGKAELYATGNGSTCTVDVFPG